MSLTLWDFCKPTLYMCWGCLRDWGWSVMMDLTSVFRKRLTFGKNSSMAITFRTNVRHGRCNHRRVYNRTTCNRKRKR